MKVRFIVLFICFWLGQAWANISIELSSKSISLDESFQIILTLKDQRADSTPNLMSLQRDFYVVGTEHSMSYMLNNGDAHTISQWKIILRPRHVGKLIIPAIYIGNQQSKPMYIVVTDNHQRSMSQSQIKQITSPVKLHVDVATKNPYLNQEVIYTVTLMNRERLIQAEYRPPHADDALMLTLGNSRHYETEINGEHYAVEEQKYAFFPQKSGSVKIYAPSFHGVAYDFVPKPVDISAHSIVLNVKPAPHKNWLPATKISLSEEVAATSAIKEGDAFERTVILEGQDIPAELLPGLHISNNENYRVYMEKPSLNNDFNNRVLTGRAVFKITYIMNKSGKIILPKINIRWFNTTKNKVMIAGLPKRVIQVLPKQIQSQHHYNMPKLLTKKATSTVSRVDHLWLLIAFLLIIVLLFIALIIWMYTRDLAYKNILHQLKHACAQNDPNQAARSLILWAGKLWPDQVFLNLHDITLVVKHQELQEQLYHLSQFLYDPLQKNKHWDGDKLWFYIKKYRRCCIKSSKNNLSELFY